MIGVKLMDVSEHNPVQILMNDELYPVEEFKFLFPQVYIHPDAFMYESWHTTLSPSKLKRSLIAKVNFQYNLK